MAAAGTYTVYQTTAASASLGFFDLAAGTATNLLFNDALSPSPYLDPSYNPSSGLDFNFPSSSTNFDLIDSIYNGGK
jgi:hypothetical protein